MMVAMVRVWYGCTTVLFLAVVAATGAPALQAAPGDTVLVSRATGTLGAKARGPFYAFSLPSHISFDGRFATFTSSAPNLDPSDGDETPDVFVRDLQSGSTTLTSRADGALGPKGNGESIAGDAAVGGRYVVFNSLASNLDPADTDATRDLYVRDVVAADTILVSRADGPEGVNANGEARRGRLSADGRFVAFESSASNLDPADPEPDADVFVRDLLTHQTALVTEGVRDAELAAFSDDGNHVAYLIPAVPLRDGMLRSEPDYGDLYVKDLRSGVRTFVSRDSNQFGVSLSADGRYVAFSSRATDLDPADRDRTDDVYVRDIEAGTTALVSRATGRDGRKSNSESIYGGSLSANGRYVAFTSAARNLDPIDGAYDNNPDVYVRDLREHRTTLASRSESGAKGNKGSLMPALSGDGRYMAFSSAAHNFDPVDRDYRHDVYVRNVRARLPAPGRPPRSWIRSVRQSGRGGFSVTGRASDDGDVQVVEVSLTRRLRDGRCQRWNALWGRTSSQGGRCQPRFDLAAHFTKRWWRRFGAADRPGTYELLTRAVDTAGQREREFSIKRGNRRVFRIR
jgi:Tol biopolymer transport system component